MEMTYASLVFLVSCVGVISSTLDGDGPVFPTLFQRSTRQMGLNKFFLGPSQRLWTVLVCCETFLTPCDMHMETGGPTPSMAIVSHLVELAAVSAPCQRVHDPLIIQFYPRDPHPWIHPPPTQAGGAHVMTTFRAPSVSIPAAPIMDETQSGRKKLLFQRDVRTDVDCFL